MTANVLILGGYGNFGKRIAKALVSQNIPIVIAGRNKAKAEALNAKMPNELVNIAIFDVNKDLNTQLKLLRPQVVINSCGPFQTNDYTVAEICIAQGIHYIDLADARDFVNGFMVLDEKAKSHNVSVITGASTVPALSSAVIEHFKHEFTIIDSLIYGIIPGQKIERGLATTQSIMSYAGKQLKTFAGTQSPVYGWQDLYRQNYPEIGKQWMANCDIPDLDLLPKHYNIHKIRFSAGLELSIMHLGLWCLATLIRLGIPINLHKHAHTLLRISNYFNHFGTANSAMHMIIRGIDNNRKPHTRTWFIVAKNGDGPQIPCIPAILLTKRLLSKNSLPTGAYPCVGLISLDEYMHELKEFNIKQVITDGNYS